MKTKNWQTAYFLEITHLWYRNCWRNIGGCNRALAAQAIEIGIWYEERPWSGFPAHSQPRVFYCILWLGSDRCTARAACILHYVLWITCVFVFLYIQMPCTLLIACARCYLTCCIPVFYCILWLGSTCHSTVHIRRRMCFACYIIEPLLAWCYTCWIPRIPLYTSRYLGQQTAATYTFLSSCHSCHSCHFSLSLQLHLSLSFGCFGEGVHLERGYRGIGDCLVRT